MWQNHYRGVQAPRSLPVGGMLMTQSDLGLFKEDWVCWISG